jgi:prophage antirepressor-like protein
MKVEEWNGHAIRFVERDGEWSAVLADVANALDLDAKEINRRLTPEFVTSARIGVYEAVSTHPISKKALP